MTKRSIARRVGFVAAAPLAGLLAISAHSLSQNHDALQSARSNEAAASILPGISAFVHALQRERSASVAPASLPGIAAELRARREDTDVAVAAMTEALSRHVPALEPAAQSGRHAARRAAEAAALDRVEMRGMVDGGAPAAEVTLVYSAAVDSLLTGVARLREDAPDLEIANDLLSLIAQMRISELAAHESAAGAQALAQGGFSSESFAQFYSLGVRQSMMIDGLGMWVAPDVLAAVDAALQTPLARAFVDLRTSLVDTQGVIPENFADAPSWLSFAAARISAMSWAERHTLTRISGGLAQARETAEKTVRKGVAATAAFGALLAGAALLASQTVGRIAGGLISAPAGLPSSRTAGGVSPIMIVDATGAVAFITPGLDETLLESTAYFSKRRPDTVFDTIKGQNIDLFDSGSVAFRETVAASVGGAPGEVRFDGRRFSIVSSQVKSSNGRTGHVVEWLELPPESAEARSFSFAMPMLLRRRSA